MPQHRRPLLLVSSIVVGLVAITVAGWLTRHRWARLLATQTIVCVIDAENAYDGLTPKLAIDRTVEAVRDRAEKISSLALVEVRGSELRIAMPRMDEPTLERVENMLTRSGRLEFKLVDDGSDYMREVAADVATSVPGVAVGHDAWQEKDSGKPHSDVYLRAVDLNALSSAWHDLLIRHPLPADREIAFERRTGGDDDDAGWRSYYVVKHADLTGDYITDAEQDWDQQIDRPEVRVQFDKEGAKRFEQLSGGAVGRKVAILLEGRINCAPVIESSINSGRVRITLGGLGDPLQEAKDLVAVLRVGSLAAPVRVVRVESGR
jgi:preprotein translocase subunit SecD